MGDEKDENNNYHWLYLSYAKICRKIDVHEYLYCRKKHFNITFYMISSFYHFILKQNKL